MSTQGLTVDDLYADMPDPFNDEYVKQELEWFGIPEQDKVELGDAVVRTIVPIGRLDNYFSANFNIEEHKVMHLSIHGETWMSLTPMELQSAALALYVCEGSVMTTGLGLGYFALRAASKENVEHVTVYEENEDVIDMFHHLHKDRHGDLFEKITIVHNDAREMEHQAFDFVFFDPYQTMLPDTVEPDIKLIMDNNDIGTYWFWGLELAVVFAAMEGILDGSEVPWTIKRFYRLWHESDQAQLKMIHAPPEEYLQTLMDTMREYNMLW